MNAQSLIEEIQKLPPAEKQVVLDFMLATEEELPRDQRSLREVLSQSPFAKVDFEPPESVRSPIRPVEL